MSNLVLLIQNEADVQNLHSASQEIINHQYRNVWVICSPAIAVDIQEASAKYDKEIADLFTAEKAAAERGDYNAAAEHKLSRQGKELERGTALESAWKQIPAETRNIAIGNKILPLTSILANHSSKIYCNVNAAQDHYEKKDWVQFLNSMSGVWPKPFEPGRFFLGWPGAIPKLVNQIPESIKIPIVNQAIENPVLAKAPEAAMKAYREEKAKAAAKAPLVSATNPDDRMAQLMSMKTFGLYGIAKGLGVEFQKRSKNEIAADIVAKEFAVTA